MAYKLLGRAKEPPNAHISVHGTQVMQPENNDHRPSCLRHGRTRWGHGPAAGRTMI